MRAALAAALAAVLAAGCLGGLSTPPPPPPTVTAGGYMVFQADGETVVPADLPPGFGAGFSVSTVSTGFHGAEPNVGITPSGGVFASAYETIIRSEDGGRTWQGVHHMTIGQTFDPMLWADDATGRVFSVHIYPDKTCSTLIYSDNPDAASSSWTELPLHCPSPVVDHEKLATGPFAGPLTPVTGAGVLPYKSLVSMCYSKVTSTHCAMSLDGGLTFLQDVVVDESPGEVPNIPPGAPDACGGLNGHQTHAKDGTIYLPYGYDCRRGRLAVSTDGGLTWTRHDLAVDQEELDPEVAVDAAGTAYYLYRGSDQAMHLLRSHDRFQTWDGPFRASPPEVKGTVFAGLAAGSAGRIGVAYLGTPDSDAGPDHVPSGTQWNVYLGLSLDADAAAPTFATVRVNPADDPVQRGTICHDDACKDGNRNLLDFIDLTPGPDGRPWVSYADGCTSADCLAPGAAPSTSRDDTLSIAWVLEGPSLLAEKGRLSAP